MIPRQDVRLKWKNDQELSSNWRLQNIDIIWGHSNMSKMYVKAFEKVMTNWVEQRTRVEMSKMYA